MFPERFIFTNAKGIIMRFLKIGFLFSVLTLLLSADLFAMAEKPPIGHKVAMALKQTLTAAKSTREMIVAAVFTCSEPAQI